MTQHLNEINIHGQAVVVSVNTAPSLKKRLQDIGLVPGTVVTVMHQSPPGDPRAYLIRGAVIALRNADARLIEVASKGGEVLGEK